MKEPPRGRTVVPLMKRLLVLSLVAFVGGCLTPPPPPAAPYRALGTEPFWNLLIDERDITFIQPDAQPLRQPTPRPINGLAGPIYQTARIHVNIVKNQRCSDGMSDRVYPDRVQVTVDGRQYNGCGGL
jgi:uncharacterized membrane protein